MYRASSLPPSKRRRLSSALQTWIGVEIRLRKGKGWRGASQLGASKMRFLPREGRAGARNGAEGSRGKHPSSKVWLRRLTRIGFSVRSGQVGRSDAFTGSGIYAFPPSPSLLAKHNIYLFPLSRSSLFADGETRDSGGGQK